MGRRPRFELAQRLLPRATFAPLLGGLVMFSCSTQENFLGYDRISVADPQFTGTDAGPLVATVATPTVPSPGQSIDPDGDAGSTGGAGSVLPSALPVEAGAPSGSVNSPFGGVDASPPELEAAAEVPELDPLVPREDLPNHLTEALGIGQGEVDARIAAIYEQLFYGDPDTQAIYFEVGDDEAYIYDVLHNDTRIDALGYGMMFSVQLDHKPEFDKLWTFTKRYLQITDGPSAGYFHWTCDVTGERCQDGPGSFGTFYVTTALFFAEARWGNGEGTYDYGTEARAVLDVMRNKETQNGGVSGGITSLFDPVTFLPQHMPDEEHRRVVNPGALVPGFFEVWAAATGDSFWSASAAATRQFFMKVPDPGTGLPPRLATHAGEGIDGELIYTDGVYPFGFNLALDETWYGAEPGLVEVANRMLSFFADFPAQPYPSGFSTTSGNALSMNPSFSLMALNGATAGVTTISEREAFIRTVWELPLAQGEYRFFDGVNKMLALLLLSGQFKPYLTAG